MPGFARSNAGISSDTTSPSRPIAQSLSVAASRPDAGVHAVSVMATTVADNLILLLLIEPSTGETSALESTHDVRIRAHRSPDEIRPVVLYHRDDRPLVDSQVIGVEPANAAHHTPVLRLQVDVERRIE